jgi:hypothetical protein
MDKFKLFLINEEKSYLGGRVGDVLTAMQDVQEDLPNLGSRHLVKIGEDLVNQIRKILHGHWSPKQFKTLKELQKVAVAIKRTIDERGDLRDIIPAATQAMQGVSGKLGVKVNDLQAPEQLPGQDAAPQDFQLTGNGPAPQQPPQGQPQPGMPPPQGQPQPGMPPMPGMM